MITIINKIYLQSLYLIKNKMKTVFAIFIITILVLASFIITDKQHLELQTTDTIIDEFIKLGNRTELFNVWHNLYKKTYDINDPEGKKRFHIFEHNLNKILDHNSKNRNDNHTLGVNQYADQTGEELVKQFGFKSWTNDEYHRVFQKIERRNLTHVLDSYDDSKDEL